MHRILCWLCMSLRWLLVAVLPVLCLIVSLRLKPAIVPRWSVELDSRTKCAGIYQEQNQSVLLLEGGPTFDMGLPAIELVGLGITTGREERSYRIPKLDFMLHAYVVGTSNVIYEAISKDKTHLILYDWQRRSDVELKTKVTNWLLIRDAVVSHKHCAVHFYERQGGNSIHCWTKGGGDPIIHFKLDDKNPTLVRGMEFSPNDRWLSLSYSVFKAPRPTTNAAHIFDIETGKIIQTLPGITRSIYWHPQEESFLALQQAKLGQAHYWQRYVYERDTFNPVGSSVAAPGDDIPEQGPGPFIVMHSIAGDHPVRDWLLSLACKPAKTLVSKAWPLVSKFHLISRTTGEEVATLTMTKDFSQQRPGYSVYADPSGRGLIVKNEESVSYWETRSGIDWYKWASLALGLMMSALLAWTNLRRTRTKQKRHAPVV